MDITNQLGTLTIVSTPKETPPFYIDEDDDDCSIRSYQSSSMYLLRPAEESSEEAPGNGGGIAGEDPPLSGLDNSVFHTEVSHEFPFLNMGETAEPMLVSLQAYQEYCAHFLDYFQAKGAASIVGATTNLHQECSASLLLPRKEPVPAAPKIHTERKLANQSRIGVKYRPRKRANLSPAFARPSKRTRR
jgi:hypothetical protein